MQQNKLRKELSLKTFFVFPFFKDLFLDKNFFIFISVYTKFYFLATITTLNSHHIGTGVSPVGVNLTNGLIFMVLLTVMIK